MSDSEKILSNNDLYAKLIRVIREESLQIKREITGEIHTENQRLFEKLNQQNKKLEELENKYTELHRNYVQLEHQIRKNNIIIFGLIIHTERNVLNLVIHKLNELLGLDIHESDIDNVYQIETSKGILIKVELVSFLKKKQILENSYKLKGSRVFIAHDLSNDDRKDNKILREHLKLAKAKNQYAKIRGNKLTINGETYTAAQLISMQSEDELQSSSDEKDSCEPNKKSSSAPQTPLPVESIAENLDQVLWNKPSTAKEQLRINSPTDPPTKRKKICEDKIPSTSSSPRITRNNKPSSKASQYTKN